MLRKPFVVMLLAPLTCAVIPASAADIDSLKGQFAFDWHKAAEKTKCAAVDDKLLALFKSDAYSCNLEAVTNTASGEPARVCTQKNDGAEYLIFTSKKSCESERETQASNSE